VIILSENKTYGYARVSAKDQNEARQIVEFQNYGIPERDIFMDKLSGKDFSRPKYLMLRDHLLRKGDTLIIKHLDRFGRNYQEILDEWKHIVKDIGADIVVIDMPLLDTRQSKDLLGTLITDIILQLLSYVAEQERHNIRQRQREGIAIARSQGVKFGRSENTFPPAWEELYAKWQAGEITAVAFYKELDIPKSSFYDLARRYRDLNDRPEP
jgi:DNA invertase Pin-like site-specific DNA recombinase